MSKIIQCINNDSPVTIEVMVDTGAAIWKYDYVDRKTDYSGQAGNSMPRKHAIGFPHELDMVSDAWSFLIVNQSSDPDPMGYEVTIKWFQGNELIADWNFGNQIKAGDSDRPMDDCTFLKYRQNSTSL